jgi:hypothetical protein
VCGGCANRAHRDGGKRARETHVHVVCVVALVIRAGHVEVARDASLHGPRRREARAGVNDASGDGRDTTSEKNARGTSIEKTGRSGDPLARGAPKRLRVIFPALRHPSGFPRRFPWSSEGFRTSVGAWSTRAARAASRRTVRRFAKRGRIRVESPEGGQRARYVRISQCGFSGKCHLVWVFHPSRGRMRGELGLSRGRRRASGAIATAAVPRSRVRSLDDPLETISRDRYRPEGPRTRRDGVVFARDP